MRKKALLLGIILLILLMIGMPLIAACGEESAVPATAPTTAPAPTTVPTTAPVPTTTPAPAPVKPMELRIASFQPVASPSYAMWKDWTSKVEAETGGRLKFTIYPSEILAKAAVTYDSVVTGVAQIGWTLPPYTPGRFTLSDVITLPGPSWKDGRQASNVMWSLWETFPAMREQYKDTHVLFFGVPPAGQLFSKKAAPHVEDIKGMKIRIPGNWAPFLKALGGVPVTLAGPDVYDAFAKGVVDGDIHPWEAPVTYRWYEVISFATVANYFQYGYFVAPMNLNTWNILPEDVKKAIDKYSSRAGSVEFYGKYWDEEDANSLKFLKEKTKLQYLEWSPEDATKATQLCKPEVDKWIADKEAKGLPGQKMYEECLRLIEQFK